MNYDKIKQEHDSTIKRLDAINNFLKTAPSGYLRRSERKGKVYYGRCEYVDNKRKTFYLKSSDTDTVLKLAAKEYCEELRSLLEGNEKALSYSLENYNPEPEATALSHLPEWQAKIVTEQTQYTHAAKIRKWLDEPYTQNPYYAEQRCIQTLRGDCVRSKAERDIADELYRQKIPYKTDCEVQLFDGSIYADFVILHPRALELYYWEHSGMLDSASYVGKNLDRIARYAANGILIGERLILTGETRNHVLSTQSIQRIIEAFFE